MRYIFSLFVFFYLIPPAHAATSVPFTIAMSEVVNVTGTPRIAVDVGGVTRYANYSGGTGTNALTFTYTMVSGDVDNDGVVLSSPIDLNGGTITDNAGNPATLTFTPPDTSGVLINAAVPSGYTAAFMDDTVTNVNKTNFGFTLNYNKANKTIHYSIASSGGGSPITGTATTTGAAQNITGLNVSALPDGKLTLSVYLTDAIGGTGTTVTDTAPMAVLDSSLVGHWTFDANDINGTTAYDRSGQGNNGIINMAPSQVTGVSGQALHFTQSSHIVTVPDNNSLDLPNELTINFWTKLDNYTSGYASHPVTKYSSTASGNYTVYFFGATSGQDGKFAFYATRNSSWGGYGFFVPQLNQWINYTLTYNSSEGARTYLNGNLLSFTPILGTLATNTANLYIGNGDLLGTVDNVRIYNRALTSAEITTLYNAEQ